MPLFCEAFGAEAPTHDAPPRAVIGTPETVLLTALHPDVALALWLREEPASFARPLRPLTGRRSVSDDGQIAPHIKGFAATQTLAARSGHIDHPASLRSGSVRFDSNLRVGIGNPLNQFGNRRRWRCSHSTGSSNPHRGVRIAIRRELATQPARGIGALSDPGDSGKAEHDVISRLDAESKNRSDSITPPPRQLVECGG